LKFELDENLDVRFAALFRERGHDVSTVHDEGLSGTEDEGVFRRVIDEERTLVTLDLDFSNPLRFPARGTAGVVVVRPGRIREYAAEEE
jgi:predicted nuclease of predicted toxin-antitoxin system